ncbi:hypothetical protein EYB53_016640 [Candidatus Chloroploca sp. M-50]|uniref:Uncharacterized protein n=1 Tax=Candidatus Chloroploca mongolica TaxID=2528176 RepID=A0ABS4DD26_9CHLR|nr:hypothetical protein [Candidatus Chloroploca mongolica]MBP1467342.1 hypothetical protein [Candidatus Chloroploca mongolica]
MALTRMLLRPWRIGGTTCPGLNADATVTEGRFMSTAADRSSDGAR